MPPQVTRQSNRAVPDGRPAATVDPWDLADHIRMLVYGASGTGKTSFAATFPDPILWLLCSGGNRPGELKSIDTPANRKRIKPHVVTSTGHFRELCAGAKHGFQSVVLDHATGFSDLILAEIIGLSPDQIPEQKSWGLASQQQYGQLGIQFKELMKGLLGLPTNVVVIAHERQHGGGDDAAGSEVIRPTVGAALTPSCAGWLNGACDYVCQTFLRPKFKTRTVTVGQGEAKKTREVQERDKGVEYVLRTEPSDVYHTKFRMPRGTANLFDIVDPQYFKVKALINGEDE